MSTTKWSIEHEKENGIWPFLKVGIGVRCQWIVAEEQTIWKKIQLNFWDAYSGELQYFHHLFIVYISVY